MNTINLGPSHTWHPSVSFQARVSGDTRFCCSAQCAGFSVPFGSSFLSLLLRIRNIYRVEQSWSFYLMPDAWYWPIRASAGGSYSGLIIKTSKLADLNQDDSLKLSQLQNVLLLLLAFSSPSNTVASTPAAKQHQIIISIRRLAGWSHSDDLSSHLETLPYMEQHKLNFCVCVCHCVLLLCKYRHWYCVSVTLPVLSPGTNTWCRILNPHQHVIGQTWLTWTPHDAVVLGLFSFT